VFALSLSWMLLLPTSLSWFDVTIRPGSVNDSRPPVLPNDSLSVATTAVLFSISNPLTLSVAVLWSTRTSWS
jgi:hypothetical protein